MNSEELRYKPTGYSYRVDENVWAGEYPVWEWEQGARIRQLKLFTDFGINYFLDLTENEDIRSWPSCCLTMLENNIALTDSPILFSFSVHKNICVQSLSVL